MKKTLSKKKKIIILSVMVALLLVTGYVNVALNSSLSSKTTTPTSTTSASFYVTYRSEREATRAQEIQFYDSILTSATASETAKSRSRQTTTYRPYGKRIGYRRYHSWQRI